MKFSILIANYNNGKYFKDCYDSIIAQTFTDWEAVIVDDASTDDSVEVISSIIKNDARFRLLFNEENKGCGFTKRKCAEKAIGEIVGFVDPDDSILPQALEMMVRAHDENPAASLVHSSFFFCDKDLAVTFDYNKAGSVIVNDQFTNLDNKVTAFASFKSVQYQRTEGIDNNLLRAVDQDIYLKLSETAPFYFIDKSLYKYRIHEKGISTSGADKALYCHLKVIVKAEERRRVNLENEVADFLDKRIIENMERVASNPRYLLSKLLKAFKKSPAGFIKKLF